MSAEHDDDQSTKAERRLDPRHGTRLVAEVEDPRLGALAFTATGFSRTGAFLQRIGREVPLPAVGSIVQLTLHWPIETHIPPVRVEAEVIRQAEDGVGVRFEIK